MNKIAIGITVLIIQFSAAAQQPQRTPEQDSTIARTQRKTQADHKAMLTLLGIKELRPGRSGNPNGANPANYDESKANPYPNLPDPLTLKNGQKVTDATTWYHQRRAEIIEDFDREIYGRVPANTPSVKWEVVSQNDTMIGAFAAKIKHLMGHVDNSSYPEIKVDIELNVVTPAQTKTAVPLIMELSFRFPAWFRLPPTPDGQPKYTPWQEQLLAKGWGFAQIYPTSYQADNGAGLTEGIIGLVNKGQNRKADDWGALRAWAWGASRALDYFEMDKDINAKRVGITGHSRFGKAALVTQAYDSRFAIGFISSSGEGGAKLHRRDCGEVVENLTGSGEYHWMAGNFIKYGANPTTWGDLPIDAHELIALCAPRPVFVSAGDKGDDWTDQKGMFMACVAAEPVYKLLGKKGMGTAQFPKVETPLTEGDLAFRQHSAGHTPAPNWETFIGFASRYFK